MTVRLVDSPTLAAILLRCVIFYVASRFGSVGGVGLRIRRNVSLRQRGLILARFGLHRRSFGNCWQFT